MKTFRILGMALSAVLMCVNLASCSSDDDPTGEKDENGVVNSGKKIAKIVSESEEWKETITFSYDDKGRLIQSTEIDEYDGEKRTRSCQYIWGDDVVKVNHEEGFSYTFTLKNGLIQSCDDGTTFTYNNSNRLIKYEEPGYKSTYTTTAIWDGDKLMSISDEDDDYTYTYGETCKKGFCPSFAVMIYDDFYGLFYVHPELLGARSNHLPATETCKYGNEIETETFTYNFDKEGYVSKIIVKLMDGATETCSITWE